jgi:transcriptional regulator with XRE-family HTH domain
MSEATNKKVYNVAKLQKVFPVILKKLMDESDTKQDVLAKELGVSRQAVGKYCNGDAEPPFEGLVKIAKFFSVPTDYLLGIVEEPTTDFTTHKITEYIGLSEKAVHKLLTTKANPSIGEITHTLSKVLEQDGSIDLLRAIHTHIWNFNQSRFDYVFYEDDQDGKDDKDGKELVAKIFDCKPNEVKKYAEAYSVSLIASDLTELIKGIDKKPNARDTRKAPAEPMKLF